MKHTLALIVLVAVAGSSRADVGPFLPFAKRTPVTHQIEATEEFADYVCVVNRYRRPLGPDSPEYNKESYENLAPGRPIVLDVQWEDVTLILVPRALTAEYPTSRELARAMSHEKPSGVKEYRFEWRETVPSWAGNEVTITHRIQRAKDGGIELVRTSWSPMWQWYAAASFLTLAVILGGWRAVRRLRRPNTPEHASPSPLG